MELPSIPPEVRAALDAEHLRLLRLVYYIAGTVTAIFSSFLIFHAIFFIILGLNPQMFQASTSANSQHVQPPPPGFFLAFGAVFFGIILLGWIFGGLQIYAGYCLGKRRNLTFAFIIAIIECLFIPWGTTLGVLTIIVLSRPTVAALFRGGGIAL